MISSGSCELSSMSNTSTSANRLNSTPLPSMTGLPASAPIFPRPSTAVPFDTTATRLPLACIPVGQLGVLFDLQAGARHARRVRHRQVALGQARFRGDDLELPGRGLS